MLDSHRLRSLLLILWIVCALLACKRGSKKELSPEARQRMEKLKPEVKQRLITIAGLAAQVKAAPTTASELPKKPASIEIIGEGWLQDPSGSGRSEDVVDLGSSLLSVCKNAVERDQMTNEDVEFLEKCSKLEYVAVVHTRYLRKPEIKMASQTYDAGKFEGQVYVFGLPKGDLVADHEVEATNSEELELDQKNPDEGHWYRLAMSDLSRNTKSAVEKSLTQTGAAPSASGGW